MVVAASAEALQTVRRGRTRVVVNTHAIPNANFVQNPDANLHADALVDKMRHAAGEARLDACDAQSLAMRFLGDTVGANILMLAYAWQLGLVPVSRAALMRAIELNNVAVTMNKLAFDIGRLAAADPAALESLRKPAFRPRVEMNAMSLRALIDDREARLLGYGGARYVERYGSLVIAAAARGEDAVTRAVAVTFYRLLAVKDEYEVARLHADPAFRTALEAQFEGSAGRDFKVTFNLAPPVLSKGKHGGQPRKRVFGQWMWRVMGAMAKCRGLRGSVVDPFGYSVERKMERQLADDYEVMVVRALEVMNSENAKDVEALVSAHERIRGYGRVKLIGLSMVKRRERELAARLGIEVQTGGYVGALMEEMRGSAGLRGISVVGR
jgi:indolepyruvate ferredoxin oxidoreductase